MASMRSRVNCIEKICRGGRAFKSPHEIKEEVVQFYEDLYKSDSSVRPKLDNLSFPFISSDTQSWLEKKFEEDEVHRALDQCDGDKAPGQDGFNFSFIKAGWDFLKDDFGILLSEFHQGEESGNECNLFITYFKSS